MVLPTDHVTRQGQSLTALDWALLEDAYRAAGADPVEHLYVTKGSWKETTATSGSTHNGAGAGDLRVWILPAPLQSNLCEKIVVELRKRGLCAWYRDAEHGGFDPHIHFINRYEPGISDSARWQVEEYDAGRNGLTNGGKDYHPRPVQRPFVWVPNGGATGVHVVRVGGRTPMKAQEVYRQSGMTAKRFFTLNGNWRKPGTRADVYEPKDVFVPPGTPVRVPLKVTAIYPGRDRA